jgi:tetratricopeptide (TPR) repeat protein
LFVAALLAKSVTASLPVALALVLWWRRGRIARRDLSWLGGMLALGAAVGVMTVLMEREYVGASGREFASSFAERILIAGRAFWFYLSKLAWPYPLSFSYPKWRIDVSAPAAWLFPATALALVAVLWSLRGRIGRGPFTGLAYFAITVSPALGFLNVYPFRFSWVADHFQYLASIGPIALAAAGAALLARTRGHATAWKAAATLSLVVLGALSFRQARNYRDLETIWRATIAVSEDSFLAQYNLGTIVHARGQVDEAMAHYAAALRAKPDYYEPMINTANILADRGRTAEAVGYYERALALAPNHPLAHYNLGLAYEELGRADDAERAYREAIRQDPAMVAARNNLAVVRFRAGDFAEAWREVEEMRRRGAQPHPDFLRALAQAMPEPR